MAMLAVDDFPDDPDQLKSLLRSRDREIVFLQARVEKLLAEQRQLRAERFGASSERGDHQYRLFDEAEASAADVSAETTEDTIEVAAYKKRVPKRKPLPEDLPRRVIEHAPERTHCDCGSALVRIGTKTSEQLDVIPAQVFVIEHRRGTYKCPCCEDAVPETAPMPAQPIPKSVASPGLLAHVAVSKYGDGLPLYRQSAMFERMSIDLSRQTLASHMVAAGDLVAPLIERLRIHLDGYDVLQMDETRVQVLKESGRPATALSWMWVLRGGPPDAPVILFRYEPSRAASVPQQLLAGYRGYLQTDGYKAYRAVLDRAPITGLGCWAHVRRRFHKAKQALPKDARSGRIDQAMAWIGKLYALEREWRELAPEARHQRRRAEAAPILDDFEDWLVRQDVNPQSLLGKAIAYARAEWPRLRVYLEDGRLEIDNNGVENAIRPFAVGRKAWLFSNTPKGASASANLYSLVETARANGVNEYAYLKHVFAALPHAACDDDLDALMPWRIDPAKLDALLVPPTIAR